MVEFDVKEFNSIQFFNKFNSSYNKRYTIRLIKEFNSTILV
jgi:hypothetical protein